MCVCVCVLQVSQLQESGEEVAIMSVNMDEESCSLFGSPTGEWFLSEQKNITNTFLSFCKTKSKSKSLFPPLL